MEPHMIDREWSQRFTVALENAINDTTTDFDFSQSLECDENREYRKDGLDGSRHDSSDALGSDSLSTQTSTSSNFKIIGREISAGKSSISYNSTYLLKKKKNIPSSCSTKHSRGAVFQRSTLSLSPRKNFLNFTDLWNRHKSNSIGQNYGRCDDSTISTKTSAFNKYVIFDLVSEYKRSVKWRQAHILSSLPPPINEENNDRKNLSVEKQKLNSHQDNTKTKKISKSCDGIQDEKKNEKDFAPSEPTTITIILMDVHNHRYEILQLQLNWCKSSVGDILKIIDKAIDDNITECFLPESEDEQKEGFNDFHCGSFESASDCRNGKDSIDTGMGSLQSNSIITHDNHDSLSGSLIPQIELTSDQFQRIDAYHQFHETPQHINSTKSSSKLKELWKVRYDGILQCRTLPDEKPIVMINCFGLMRYEVMPHEVFLAKPKGMSARETASHADIMFYQLAEKGMILRISPETNDDASSNNKPREVLTTLSYLAKSRIVNLDDGEIEDDNTTNKKANFLTFSPPFDIPEPVLPPRCPKKRVGNESMKVHPFPNDSFQFDERSYVDNISRSAHSLPQSTSPSFVSSPPMSDSSSHRSGNSPPISEPSSPATSPVKCNNKNYREISFELDDYNIMNDTVEMFQRESQAEGLITVGQYQMAKYTPEIPEGDTPLLSRTRRKSSPSTKSLTLGSFDAAIRSLGSSANKGEVPISSFPSNDNPTQENHQSVYNGTEQRRSRRLSSMKIFPSKNPLGHLARKVKDRKNLNKRTTDGGEKSDRFSIGYSKVDD